jgi:hypothetical protein
MPRVGLGKVVAANLQTTSSYTGEAGHRLGAPRKCMITQAEDLELSHAWETGNSLR